MLLQMKIILQTALGKCFNKPPIMPCRVIWTRNKIHTIFLDTQNILGLSDTFDAPVKSKILILYTLFFLVAHWH